VVAKVSQRYWHQLAAELGLGLSDDDHRLLPWHHLRSR
jgi:hypothetical protein